ncbi:MAG: chromosomal replication initiator protein DnaA [Spirochaetia bacterium]|jgi:chromosomal replication initiator protein|nr:chromosomal replication initiator protein DnaA [Spirochaetia bacterium]
MNEIKTDYSDVWQETIKQIREETTKSEYMLWLNRLSYESSKENAITACVPSTLLLDQIRTRYLQTIEDKLEDVSGGKKIALELVVKKNHARDEKQEKKDAPLVSSVETKKAIPQHAQLNERYSFENFVIGENNQFAASAAIAIAKNPGRSYNPCLIYGGVGLGKTHLLQAIGNQIHKTFEDKKVVYVTAENFTNEFIYNLENRTPLKFKNKYRNTDVLLIDDIHFFQKGKKESTLEELFHTFNALYENNKHIVFTCDRPISEMRNIEERIRTRFSQGLTTNLDAPSYETRVAILKKKVSTLSVAIPDDVIDLICNNVTTNVRDLEAALTTLVGYAELVNKNITLEIAQTQLRDIFSGPEQNNVTIDTIKRTVADYYGISFSDLSARKKTKALSDPRQMAMFLCREITEYATTEIGQEFGGRDHSTVMHACEKIKNKMKADSTLEPAVQNLIKKIRENSIKV